MSEIYQPTPARLIYDAQFICSQAVEVWGEILRFADERDSILEIGAGTGKLGIMYAIWLGCDVTLLDVDDGACRYQIRLLKMLEDMLGTRLSVITRREDVFQTTSEAKWDVVISEGVVEHFTGPARQRMMDIHAERSRDKVIIITTNGDNPKAVAKATSRKEPYETAQPYERPYRRLELQAAMEQSGLKDVRVTYRNMYLLGVGKK